MSDILNNFIDENSGRSSNQKYEETENSTKKVYKISLKYKDVEEEITLAPFRSTATNLLNKGIILYGATGTGKSRIIREFMYKTKHEFPMVVAFAPTNKEKHDYDAIIPKPLVYEDDWGLPDISNIYKRQRMASEIYNAANNIKVLQKLFKRVSSRRDENILDRIDYLKKKTIRNIKDTYTDVNMRDEKIKEIEDIFAYKITAFYKQIINPKAKKLEAQDLSEEERIALKYRNLVSKTLVVFDDAYTEIMSIIKMGVKKKDDTIKNFFYKGRHAGITHWYGIQDDKIDSELRKNAHISVFTTKQVALSYFKRSANNFSMLDQKRAETVINLVFDQKTIHKHSKLIYSRLDKDPFTYIVAGSYTDKQVQMCSEPVREYCKEVESKESGLDKSNPFYKSFTNDI